MRLSQSLLSASCLLVREVTGRSLGREKKEGLRFVGLWGRSLYPSGDSSVQLGINPKRKGNVGVGTVVGTQGALGADRHGWELAGQSLSLVSPALSLREVQKGSLGVPKQRNLGEVPSSLWNFFL